MHGEGACERTRECARAVDVQGRMCVCVCWGGGKGGAAREHIQARAPSLPHYFFLRMQPHLLCSFKNARDDGIWEVMLRNSLSSQEALRKVAQLNHRET